MFQLLAHRTNITVEISEGLGDLGIFPFFLRSKSLFIASPGCCSPMQGGDIRNHGSALPRLCAFR